MKCITSTQFIKLYHQLLCHRSSWAFVNEAQERLGHAAGDAVGWGSALQFGRSRVPFAMCYWNYWPNPSGLGL